MNKLAKELKKILDEMLEKEDDSFEFNAKLIVTCMLYLVAVHYDIDDIEEARKKLSLLEKKLTKRRQF